MRFFIKFVVFPLFVLGSFSVSAGEYFENLRNDRSIPSHCRSTQKSFFKSSPATFTFGRRGATHRGFDYESSLSRRGATVLWNFLRGRTGRRSVEEAARNERTLLSHLQTIEEHRQKMDFSFSSEGEVLEIVAIEQMKAEYSPNQYYITGSVAYHGRTNRRILGELDVVIGNKSDCSVVAVGEVKLGRRPSKARQQLRRFIGFYNRELKEFFGHEMLRPVIGF